MVQSDAAIDTIKKEIAILNPGTVIFCSTYWLFEDFYIKELKKIGIKIFDMWHPAARKSNRVMIDAVKNG